MVGVEANGSGLKEAILYEKRPGGRVRCGVCQWRCVVAPGKSGHCKTRVNVDGVLYTSIYGLVSSLAADPIEKKPVYHYKPGSIVLSLGSYGCNFRCPFCQNWHIAYADGTCVAPGEGRHLSPAQVIDLAQSSSSAGVAWTYNEPAIWLEYTLDCARLAKQAGLYTVYVTNGFVTPEGLDLIGPYLDVYRVDVKSLSDRFHRELIKLPDKREILEVAERAKKKWNMHLEVVTNVVPGWNDDPEDLRGIAEWIGRALGPSTPWHVTRFFPQAEMTNVPPTPPETLTGAREIGRRAGLRFVYLGNIAGDQDTLCPQCGRRLVARAGYSARIVGLTATGECSHCGAGTGIVR
jgi:pyruvate formate lyase activating enzyme